MGGKTQVLTWRLERLQKSASTSTVTSEQAMAPSGERVTQITCPYTRRALTAQAQQGRSYNVSALLVTAIQNIPPMLSRKVLIRF